MDTSIFPDKNYKPDSQMLGEALGDLMVVWEQLSSYVKQVYPAAIEEWNFPGAKYGWSFRLKDKKRAILYLLPRDKFFMAAFVFGEKATTEALESNISPGIKNIISSAMVYAEGRGFRIEIRTGEETEDIKKLVDIKLSH